MPNKIYVGEIGERLLNNPLENTNYLNILGLLPTLGTEIQKKVVNLLQQNYNSLQKEQLNPNHLFSHDLYLENTKKELIKNLYELEGLIQEGKSITIFGDDCFTNTLMINTISKILGEKNFERFVEVRNINLSKSYDENNFKTNNNNLFIIGGSLHDTYTIDKSYYTGEFAEKIKKLGDNFDMENLNNRVIGVCFGQQFLANLLGIKNNHTSSIIATYKGLAQFGPSNCTLQNYKYVNKVYQEILAGISNSGTNNQFSTFFTRTGYVDFDLLKTGYESLVVPLIKDEITGSCVGWGTNNGKIFGAQFHSELSYFNDRYFVRDQISSIIPYLSQYKNHEKLIENFNFHTGFHDIIQKDVGEYFYTFALKAFIKSIKDEYIKTHKKSNSLHVYGENTQYSKIFKELRKIVIEQVDMLLSFSNPSINDSQERLSLLKKIDESGRLLLNSRLDWKVNRGLGEVSQILGLKNIGDLLEEQRKFLHTHFPGKKVIFFRDWGAGDGSLLKDLYSQYKGKDILFYGVGDYVYFDIYPFLKQKGLQMGIPQEVIILLFEEFLEKYSNFYEGSIYNKVQKAFQQTHIQNIQMIHNSSITGTDTAMFSHEGEHKISQNSIDYIQENDEKIEKLKDYIIDNFYSLFEGYFERIYISKFNDFDIDNSHISKVDFQVAIRSTSHLDGREYMKIIFDYIYRSANPGSIYIDNGVHRSYNGIPRIRELFELHKMRADIHFSLIYDQKTNYFPGVIIEKTPYHTNDFLQKQLQTGYEIVSLEEAYNSTFFKLEYFIRSFMVNNFKNYDIFWNFNKEIISTLKQVMILLQEKNILEIKNIFLNLINYIATNYKSDTITYDLINMSILEKYSIEGESLEKIVSSEIYIPNWMNLDAERKY